MSESDACTIARAVLMACLARGETDDILACVGIDVAREALHVLDDVVIPNLEANGF